MKGFLERGAALYGVLFLWPWVGSSLGYAIGSRLLLPFLDLLPAYAAMLLLLRRGCRNRAILAMLVWAVGLGAAGTTLAWYFPEQAEVVTLNGADYRGEMFEWIRTGRGAESDPGIFVPQHLRHLAVFLLLSLGTVSLLSMAFGAILMNYMSFYVGSLIAQAESPGWILWMGWHPWSLIRVASYVTLGVVLAEPLLSRLWRYPARLRDLTPYAAGAGVGLILDAGLKALLAPSWRLWLLAAMGPGFGGS